MSSFSAAPLAGMIMGATERNSLLEAWRLQSCSGVSTPVAAAEPCEESKVEKLAREGTTYRRRAARLDNLAQDRPDIAVGANFFARRMAHPKLGDEARMKRQPGDAQPGDRLERQRLGRRPSYSFMVLTSCFSRLL